MKNLFKRLTKLLLVGLLILLQTVVGMPTALAETGGTDYMNSYSSNSRTSGLYAELVRPIVVKSLDYLFDKLDDLFSDIDDDDLTSLENRYFPPLTSSSSNSLEQEESHPIFSISNVDESAAFAWVMVGFNSLDSGDFSGRIYVEAIQCTEEKSECQGLETATVGEDFESDLKLWDGQPYWQLEHYPIYNFFKFYPIDDDVEEGKEYFLFKVRRENNEGTILETYTSPPQYIQSDDPYKPSIIHIESSYTVDEGGSITIEPTLSSRPINQVTFDYQTQDGSAKAELGDYKPAMGSLKFLAGFQEILPFAKPIVVQTDVDEVLEDDQSFRIYLSNIRGAVIDQGMVTVTIKDSGDGFPVQPIIRIGDTSVESQEGMTATIPLTVSGEVERQATVEYTFGGDATGGEDYDNTVHTVTFDPGSETGEISVPTNDDHIYEPNETFTVTLTKGTNAFIDGEPATITIFDNDLPQVDIQTTASVDEGNNLEIPVTLTPISEYDVTVTYETMDIEAGNSATADEDYDHINKSLTFAAGSVEKVISVVTKGDNLAEGYETFSVNLSNPIGGILGNSTSSVTINDLTVEAQIDDSTVAEEAQELTFNVSLSAPYMAGNVTIDYTIEGVEAEEGRDYSCTPGCKGTLTFEPGETNQLINIEVIDDQRYEVDETLKVTLSDSVNVQLPDDAVAIGTIENHDLEPLVSISNVTVSESEEKATLTVYLSKQSDYDTVMNYHTEAATANQDDFTPVASNTLTIEPGTLQEQIDIAITDDSDTENEEFFLVALSNIEGAGVSTPFAKVTIEDNDSGGGEPEFVPSVNVRGDSVREFDGRAVGEAEFVLYLNSPMDEDVEVSYQTESGSAGEKADYQRVWNSYTFPAEETEHTITVPLVCSDELEDEEFFYLKLSDSSGNITVTSPKARAVIEDAEEPCP